MKRSEMIKIMQDAFHEGMSYKEKLLSGMELEQAEKLLTVMERAGMMPPKNGMETIWTGEYDITVPEYQWEKE